MNRFSPLSQFCFLVIFLLSSHLVFSKLDFPNEQAALAFFQNNKNDRVSKEDVVGGIEQCWFNVSEFLINESVKQDNNFSNDVKQAVANLKQKLDKLIFLSSAKKEIDIVKASFQWAQSPEFIFLNIKFSHRWSSPGALKVKDEEIISKNKHFYFSALSNDSNSNTKKYVIDLQLLHDVVESETKYNFASVGKVVVTLKKEKKKIWNRLLLSKKKHPNMQIWWDMKEKHAKSIQEFLKEKEEKKNKRKNRKREGKSEKGVNEKSEQAGIKVVESVEKNKSEEQRNEESNEQHMKSENNPSDRTKADVKNNKSLEEKREVKKQNEEKANEAEEKKTQEHGKDKKGEVEENEKNKAEEEEEEEEEVVVEEEEKDEKEDEEEEEEEDEEEEEEDEEEEEEEEEKEEGDGDDDDEKKEEVKEDGTQNQENKEKVIEKEKGTKDDEKDEREKIEATEKNNVENEQKEETGKEKGNTNSGEKNDEL